jgi:hypothetical protein
MFPALHPETLPLQCTEEAKLARSEFHFLHTFVTTAAAVATGVGVETAVGRGLGVGVAGGPGQSKQLSVVPSVAVPPASGVQLSIDDTMLQR